jgi:glyoxylase-like metal-dependent hydrolase (beta-lactamase superfamily II)
MRYVDKVYEKELNTYLAGLEESGYTKLASWKIGKNSFSRLVKDTVEVYAYYTLTDATARIIISPYDNTADARINNSNTGESEVLLTQVGINYTEVINGMSYIIRTPKGSFIVIDGGWADQGEAKQIFDLISEQNQNGGKPVVAAWILTHPHSDHIGAISEFSTQYSDQVVLERLIWNFVSDATMRASDSDKMITDMNGYYGKIKRALNNKNVWGGVEIVKPHTGQTLTFDGVSITVIETHEDIFPNIEALEYMNAASMAFVVEAAGNRMLFLGDCTSSGTSLIAKRYADWLKCDYLQPTHHGSTGGNLDLYKYAAPTVTLWCSSLPRFEEYKGSDFNKYLLANCAEHYYSGNGTVTLTIKKK